MKGLENLVAGSVVGGVGWDGGGGGGVVGLLEGEVGGEWMPWMYRLMRAYMFINTYGLWIPPSTTHRRGQT